MICQSVTKCVCRLTLLGSLLALKSASCVPPFACNDILCLIHRQYFPLRQRVPRGRIALTDFRYLLLSLSRFVAGDAAHLHSQNISLLPCYIVGLTCSTLFYDCNSTWYLFTYVSGKACGAILVIAGRVLQCICPVSVHWDSRSSPKRTLVSEESQQYPMSSVKYSQF